MHYFQNLLVCQYKKIFLEKCANFPHSWKKFPKLHFYEDPFTFPNSPFSNFVHPYLQSLHQCFFCCLVSLTECVITPHLICYSPSYYRSTHIKPWYLSNRGTLLRILCNKASGLPRSDTYGFFASTLIVYHTHSH